MRAFFRYMSGSGQRQFASLRGAESCPHVAASELPVCGAARLLFLVLAVCAALLMGVAALSPLEAYADDASAKAGATAAVAGDPFEDAVEVDLDDGMYLVDIALEGGSGRASLTSPTELEVFDGRGVVKLIWSSSNYDYVVLSGKKYLPTNKGGDSTFVVPVTAYDEPVAFIGDTTAMSEAHEVDYSFTVLLSSVRAYDADEAPQAPGTAMDSSSGSAPAATGSRTASAANASVSAAAAPAQDEGLPWPWIVFIACAVASAACVGVTIGVLRGYLNQ